MNHWNDFKFISVFCFTGNHVWNWNKIICAAERVLKLFQNYFSDNEHAGKYSWAATSSWNSYFEIIWGKFPLAEIKWFHTDVDEGWNNFEIILSHMQPQRYTCMTLKSHDLDTRPWPRYSEPAYQNKVLYSQYRTVMAKIKFVKVRALLEQIKYVKVRWKVRSWSIIG